MENKKIFITTAIDYTNGVIHVGHAYEKVLADAITRLYKLVNGSENVYLLTGTDEHGNTNYKAAAAAGVSTIDFVTKVSQEDQAELDSLSISYNRFIRTTDEDHKKIAASFFETSYKNGDIYKAEYEGLYCEGCESYKTLTELVEGKCPLHKSREIQKYKEENYFFKWSKYTDFLRDLISTDTLEVKPEGKKKEMLALLDQGLNDIPVSRPKYKLPWGIDVPFDSEQVIYVWFDALINYYSEGVQKGFWNDDTQIIHFVGKDIARWHTLLWPAMLKSAGYKLPNKVYVHGFLNLNGQKISKSLGNVIRPTELVTQFGADVTRYYLLKNGPIVEDTDISIDNLKEVYTSDLANGLGNTVARLAKLAEKSGFEFAPLSDKVVPEIPHDFRIDFYLQNVWKLLSDLDKHINENEPWAITDTEKLRSILTYEINELRKVAIHLIPIMPNTAQKISEQFAVPFIKAQAGLFPRLA